MMIMTGLKKVYICDMSLIEADAPNKSPYY